MSTINNEFVAYQPQKFGKLIDSEGNDIGFQIATSGGSVNLNSGKKDENGFYVAVAGNEGVLSVRLKNKVNFITLPFFSGWNPVIIAEIAITTGNTATNIYWGN